jgi:hypothetical protein
MQQQWEANGLSIQRVDVSDMPTGFYVYKISNGGRLSQGKIVKN